MRLRKVKKISQKLWDGRGRAESAKEFFATWQLWQLWQVLALALGAGVLCGCFLGQCSHSFSHRGSLTPETCHSRESTVLPVHLIREPRISLVILMLLTLLPGLFSHPCDLFHSLKCVLLNPRPLHVHVDP